MSAVSTKYTGQRCTCGCGLTAEESITDGMTSSGITRVQAEAVFDIAQECRAEIRELKELAEMTFDSMEKAAFARQVAALKELA